MVNEKEFDNIVSKLNKTGTGSYRLTRRRSKGETLYFIYVVTSEPIHSWNDPFKEAIRSELPMQAYPVANAIGDASFRVLTPEQRGSGQFERYFYESY